MLRPVGAGKQGLASGRKAGQVKKHLSIAEKDRLYIAESVD
jgi:hypothetical protein